ncbi:MAG: hypothetical protein ACRCWJ_03645 [Casimicrobium sp.]
MKISSHLSSRAFAIAFMAMIVFAMQTLGVAHRASHARHAASAQELWLAVANGETVSVDVWQAEQRPNASLTSNQSDRWHHESRADCERFDALCAGDAPIAIMLATPLLPDIEPGIARAHRALIAARTARAQARAPPLA